jgi:hypothetical protein
MARDLMIFDVLLRSMGGRWDRKSLLTINALDNGKALITHGSKQICQMIVALEIDIVM